MFTTVKQIETARHSFVSIASHVACISQNTFKVESELTTQRTAANYIEQNVKKIETVAMDTVDNARSITLAADQLVDIAETLNRVGQRFKL